MRFPTQDTPGEYVIHHRDYIRPVTVNITEDDKGNLWWEAFGKRSMVYISRNMLWQSIYAHLNVDS